MIGDSRVIGVSNRESVGRGQQASQWATKKLEDIFEDQ